MKTQIEVDEKIFKVGDIITAKGHKDCIITAITDYNIVKNIAKENCKIELILPFELLGTYWSVKKPEREKIEFKAYISGFGTITYCTNKGEYVFVGNKVKNILIKIQHFNKLSLIPELPRKFMWADTLEYCDS